MSNRVNSPVKYGLTVAAVVVFALALGFYAHEAIGAAGDAEKYPLSWFIIVAAILGSIVNQPFRQSELRHTALGWLLGYLCWKCAVAIVFAFVLYIMFIAGLISGDMFPRFVNTTANAGGEYVSMEQFMTSIEPESNRDAAKVLVWSFLAGYSEKFVPNLMTRMLSASAEPGDRGVTS